MRGQLHPGACWGVSVRIKGLTHMFRGSHASMHTTTDTVAPKTQTTSPTTARFHRFLPRWSALWAPHQPKPRSDCHQTGGIALHEAPTRRQQTVRELHVVQNPHRHRHGGCRRARLRRPWAAGPGRTTSQRAEPHVNTPGPTGMEGARGTGGHGRASRRGAEQSEVA